MHRTLTIYDALAIADEIFFGDGRTDEQGDSRSRINGCPLDGDCLQTNVVCLAEVPETKGDGTVAVEKYVGYTTDYKTRFMHHEKSFNNQDYKHETVLSTYIWECKSRGSTWKFNWKILDRGQPFNPVTRERFYILRKPQMASLNHRQEIGTLISKCLFSEMFRKGKCPTSSEDELTTGQ